MSTDVFLELNSQAANIYLVFFGFYDLLIVYLIIRSAFLPRNSGLADGACRFGLADLLVTAVCKLSVSLQSGRRLPRGTSADAVAPRAGRKRSTMAAAGQRHMKTAVYPQRDL